MSDFLPQTVSWKGSGLLGVASPWLAGSRLGTPPRACVELGLRRSAILAPRVSSKLVSSKLRSVVIWSKEVAERPFCKIAWMHCLVAPGKSVALLSQDGNGLLCSTDDANATATAAAAATAAASATGTTLFENGLVHENTLLRSNDRRH